MPRLHRPAAIFASLVILALPACLAAQQGAAPDAATRAARARVARILRSTPLIDGHNDLPWEIRGDATAPGDVDAYDLRQRTRGHTDLARLRQGLVGGQFWSVYIPGDRNRPPYVQPSAAAAGAPGYARVQLEQIDIARRIIAKYPELELVTTAAGVRDAYRRGKVASLLGMEGGHAIENSLGALRAYRALGVAYMTLTHNSTLDWADAAADTARHGGLTPFGVEVVREMNRLGMLVDLSHVSPGTMSDALDASTAPVIFSHSSARAVTDHPRNVPDSILVRLKQNGGVVMVTFVGSFVTRERGRPATLDDVIAHVEHIRRVAGIDHVGIGGDYDGTTELPAGLEDVSTYPVLLAELVKRGWTDADIRKLAGENILRVMTAAERVAGRLGRERGASLVKIE